MSELDQPVDEFEAMEWLKRLTSEGISSHTREMAQWAIDEITRLRAENAKTNNDQRIQKLEERVTELESKQAVYRPVKRPERSPGAGGNDYG